MFLVIQQKFLGLHAKTSPDASCVADGEWNAVQCVFNHILEVGRDCRYGHRIDLTSNFAVSFISLLIFLIAVLLLATGSAKAAERFGDWELVCQRAAGPVNAADYQSNGQVAESAAATDRPSASAVDTQIGSSNRDCRLQQAQAVNAGNDVVFLLNIVRQNKRNVAVISVPLGVYLPAGLELRVDGGKARRAVFEACNLTGCHAGFALEAGLERALKRGRTLIVTLRDTKANAVPITVSLNGITAGMKALGEAEGGRDG